MTKEEILAVIEVLMFSLKELDNKLTYEQGKAVEKLINILSEKI